MKTLEIAADQTIQIARAIASARPTPENLRNLISKRIGETQGILHQMTATGSSGTALTPSIETAIEVLAQRVQRASVDLARLQSQLNEPFTLFVVGMGNYGKSTLINTLLEQSIAPTDFLPKTWKIDLFRQVCDDDRVMITFMDGSRKEMSRKHATEFLDEEERKRADSETLIYGLYERQSENLSLEDKESLLEYLRATHLYLSPVVEVEWRVRPGKHLSDFIVVDTPGLTQYLNSSVVAGIEDHFLRADGIVWLLDATAISSSGTSKLLGEIESKIKGLSPDQSKMIALVNRIDLIAPDEVCRVMDEARSIFGEYFHTILPFSAKRAWEGVGPDRDSTEPDDFYKQLLADIDRSFRQSATSMRSNSKRLALTKIVHARDQYLQDGVAGLRLVCKRREESIERTKQRIAVWADQAKRRTRQAYKEYAHACRSRAKTELPIIIDTAGRLDTKEKQSAHVERSVMELIFEPKDLERSLKGAMANELEQLESLRSAILREFDFRRFKFLKRQGLSPGKLSNMQVSIKDVGEDLDCGSFFAGIGNVVIGIAAALLLWNPLGLLAALAAHKMGLFKGASRSLQVDQIQEKIAKALLESEEGVMASVQQKLQEQAALTRQEIVQQLTAEFESRYGRLSEVESFLSSYSRSGSTMNGSCSEEEPLALRLRSLVLASRIGEDDAEE